MKIEMLYHKKTWALDPHRKPTKVLRLSAAEIKTLRVARAIAEAIRDKMPKERDEPFADAKDQSFDCVLAGIEHGVDEIVDQMGGVIDVDY